LGRLSPAHGGVGLGQAMWDALADESRQQQWSEHTGGQHPDPKLSVLHVLDNAGRAKLTELLTASPIANMCVRNLQLVGSGRNVSEVLILASAFPGADVTVVEPYHSRYLRERIDDLQRTHPGLESVGRRISYVEKPIQEHVPAQPADLTFMSAVLQDRYIIPRIRDGQHVLDAVSASTRRDGLLATTFVLPNYRPYMEFVGLKMQHCVNQYYVFRNSKQNADAENYLRPPEDAVGFDAQPRDPLSSNDRVTYQFGRWAVESINNNGFPTHLAVRGVGVFPADTTELLVNRESDLILNGPVGTPLWQLRLQQDGRMSVLLSKKLVNHMISDNSSANSNIDPTLFRGLFDFKWGFWSELRAAFNTGADPSAVHPAKIWGVDINRIDII
jgi:hypothetical protein